MIVQGVFLTDEDAELFSHALSEIKAKAQQEGDVNLDDSRALSTLVSRSPAVGRVQEKETRHADPLGKRIILGTIIRRLESADSQMSGSRQS